MERSGYAERVEMTTTQRLLVSCIIAATSVLGPFFLGAYAPIPLWVLFPIAVLSGLLGAKLSLQVMKSKAP
jgi:hypothetical protein